MFSWNLSVVGRLTPGRVENRNGGVTLQGPCKSSHTAPSLDGAGVRHRAELGLDTGATALLLNLGTTVLFAVPKLGKAAVRTTVCAAGALSRRVARGVLHNSARIPRSSGTCGVGGIAW
jgi:hypothetical protein